MVSRQLLGVVMTIVTFTTLAGATVYYPPAGLKPRELSTKATL